MKICLDASLVVGVVLHEADAVKLAAAVGSADVVVISDFCFGEVVSAIALRVRRHNLGGEFAAERIADLRGVTSHWQTDTITAPDIARATDLVARITLALRLPDAIHIAIAERIGATLITTDQQQHRAALAVGLASINPLADGTPA